MQKQIAKYFSKQTGDKYYSTQIILSKGTLYPKVNKCEGIEVEIV
jgi:hypothetical protein